MGLLPNIGYPQTGDIVEKGTYQCMNCTDIDSDSSIIILNSKQKLPLCPVCGYTYWMPV